MHTFNTILKTKKLCTLKGWILWYVNCVSVKKRTWQDCFTWTMLMTAVCFLRQLEPNSLLLCVIISLMDLWLINPVWRVSGLFLSSSDLPENSETEKNKEIDALNSREWVQGIHIRLLWKRINQSAWKWKDDCFKKKKKHTHYIEELIRRKEIAKEEKNSCTDG